MHLLMVNIAIVVLAGHTAPSSEEDKWGERLSSSLRGEQTTRTSGGGGTGSRRRSVNDDDIEDFLNNLETQP